MISVVDLGRRPTPEGGFLTPFTEILDPPLTGTEHIIILGKLGHRFRPKTEVPFVCCFYFHTQKVHYPL